MLENVVHQHEWTCRTGHQGLVVCECGDIYCNVCGAQWLECGPTENITYNSE